MLRSIIAGALLGVPAVITPVASSVIAEACIGAPPVDAAKPVREARTSKHEARLIARTYRFRISPYLLAVSDRIVEIFVRSARRDSRAGVLLLA